MRNAAGRTAVRVALGAAFMLVPVCARSQGMAGYRLALAPGAELRIATHASPTAPSRARAERVAGDTLFYFAGGSEASRSLLLSDVATLQVRGGKDHRRGAIIGAVVLGAITGVAGGIDYGRHDISGGDYVGSTIGNVALGALLGYAFAPTGWVRVPLPGRSPR
jgi:hypothetical protein